MKTPIVRKLLGTCLATVAMAMVTSVAPAAANADEVSTKTDRVVKMRDTGWD